MSYNPNYEDRHKPGPYPPITGQPLQGGFTSGGSPPITGQPLQGGFTSGGSPPPEGQPLRGQPEPGNWMTMVMIPANCPPGLAYLTTLSELCIKQQVEMVEVFLGCETKNRFNISNSAGQHIYKAKEESDFIIRCCCGPIRPFEMSIKDENGLEVIHLSRELACDNCLFPCCLQRMEVFSPPGTLVGTIEQQWSICIPFYLIKNAVGDVIFQIEGPLCRASIFCQSIDFKVLSKDGQFQVGKISKKWSGAMRELFTDADSFGVSFPLDLDVRMKAVMLGAVFLIDIMFFESSS